MIQVESGKLSQENCEILAEITVSARKGTPLESKKTIEEITNSIVRLSEDDSFQILIALDSNRNIVGWTYDYVAFPLMTFISGFFPLVKESDEKETIALALIEASKKKIAEHQHSRLELELEFPTENHRIHAAELIKWYKKCGFQFAAEEVRMKSDLNKIDLPERGLSPEYELKDFSEVSYQQLEELGFQVFKDSNDDLFLSMNNAEQKVTLEHYFSKTEPFINVASGILEKDGKYVGFIITRMRDGEVLIGPIGLIHEERSQGLANYMLANALANLKELGKTCACFDTSIANSAAMKLYERFCFKIEYSKQFYFWSP